MGLNLDLTHMLGLPAERPCPRCGKMTPTHFDDYDIECGNANPSPGRWRLYVACNHCEHDWKHDIQVALRS